MLLEFQTDRPRLAEGENTSVERRGRFSDTYVCFLKVARKPTIGFQTGVSEVSVCQAKWQVSKIIQG